jgi:hypothetical protein
MADDNVIEVIRTTVGEHSSALAVLESWKVYVDKQLDTFVTKTEFTVVRVLVFSLAGISLATLLGAVLSRVLIK